MTPEERELRRALDSRSAEVSPEFRARLASVLAEGRPAASYFLPALAAVAAVVLMFATVGVLLMARQARNQPPPAAATTPTPTPTPTLDPTRFSVPGVVHVPTGAIILPSDAQLSAPSSHDIWVLMENQYLYRSTDQGKTWKQMPLPPLGPSSHQEISFVTDAEGWLMTEGPALARCSRDVIDIWQTLDAGRNWEHIGAKGISDSECKAELSFVDSNRGFLDAFGMNHQPSIYRTIDGGRSWVAGGPLPGSPGFTPPAGGPNLVPGRVRAFGSTLLVAASAPNTIKATEFIFRSTDGGASWTYLAPAKDPNNQVVFLTATRWLQLIGPGQSTETTNGGSSWHRYASDYSQAAPVSANFDFADSVVGYGTVRGEIYRTVDGGLHWTTIHTPGT